MSLKATYFLVSLTHYSTERCHNLNDSRGVCFHHVQYSTREHCVTLWLYRFVPQGQPHRWHIQGSHHLGCSLLLLLLLLLWLFLTQEHLQFFTLISAFGNDCCSIHDYGLLRKEGFLSQYFTNNPDIRFAAYPT